MSFHNSEGLLFTKSLFGAFWRAAAICAFPPLSPFPPLTPPLPFATRQARATELAKQQFEAAEGGARPATPLVLAGCLVRLVPVRTPVPGPVAVVVPFLSSFCPKSSSILASRVECGLGLGTKSVNGFLRFPLVSLQQGPMFRRIVRDFGAPANITGPGRPSSSQGDPLGSMLDGGYRHQSVGAVSLTSNQEPDPKKCMETWACIQNIGCLRSPKMKGALRMIFSPLGFLSHKDLDNKTQMGQPTKWMASPVAYSPTLECAKAIGMWRMRRQGGH